MIQVLVVDDERLIREGIAHYIASLEGFRVAGACKNGRAAAEAARALRPDLIVTDIVMPEWDGIRLLRELRGEKLDCEFILLTGHSEFQYAREGIVLGALDYVVKPVDMEGFRETLQRAAAKIQAKKKNRESLKRYRFASYLENGSGAAAAADEAPFYRVFVLSEHTPPQEREALLPAVGAWLDRWCADEYCAFYKQGYLTVVLTGRDAQDEHASWIGRPPLPEGGFRIGIGCAVGQTQKIAGSFEQAKTAAKDLLRTQGESLRRFSELPYQCPPSESLYMKDYLLAEGYLHSMQVDAFTGCVLETVDRLLEKTPAYAVIDFVNKCVESAILFVSSRSLSPDHLLYRDLFEQIDRAFTVRALKESFCSFMQAAGETIRDSHAEKRGELIDNILDYIGIHYMQPISADEIADIFHIHPNYLSQLFKQKTGINYNDYVTQLRLNKAKILLLGQRYTVETVASMVGYTSAKYFYRLFKSKTGVSPLHYVKVTLNADNSLKSGR